MARCRRLLDLDADPEAVVDQLGSDRTLGQLVHKAPGRRIPRTVDEHELAIRVVLSQRVPAAVVPASAARLVRRFGTPVADPQGSLTHVFPLADELAAIGAGDIGVPRSRHRRLGLLVGSLADGTVQLDVGSDWQQARSQLAGIPGIDAWTIEMIAMRGLGDPDAFPSTDPGIRTAAAALGLPRDPPALAEHAERWRPWRSYAAQYLWATLDQPDHRRLRAAPSDDLRVRQHDRHPEH
jgi:AraC family transcriptional regulator of adaptative response / DNA-3-methyladenine glycosylase II